MRRRTPQEKKKLSLDKDRRNVWGEAPHAARRIIPLRKKLRNRANRHREDSKVRGASSTVEADQVECSIQRKRPKDWRKYPDAPLREVITEDRLRRQQTHGRRMRSRARQAIYGCGFAADCPVCETNIYFVVGPH